jgi:hypothetical protein
VSGMPSSERLYSAAESEVTYELVRQFVLDAEESDLFSESLTFEIKEKRDHNNVADAVGALSNTDGGIVLVGVKEDAAGDNRLVGVPQQEHDRIVSNLHNLIPEAMPEVIPVRMPGTDKLIIVLRIDADAVAHPVIVAGKIFYRIPGHTVPADRQRVLDLVNRDQVGAAAERGRMDVPRRSWQPSNIPLWPEELDHELNGLDGQILRVVGGLTLPHRVLERPWLNSEARQAALDVLNNSPLRTNPTWSTPPWNITEARATYLRLFAGDTDYETYSAHSAVYLNLADRKLSLLYGFRWRPGRSCMLSPEHFYWALLGSIVTIASGCRHIARKIDAAEPSEPDSFEGWLHPARHRPSVLEMVDLSQFERDNRDQPPGGYFPPFRLRSLEIGDLDRLARDWLTYWTLDIGIRGFEDWLANLDRPDFLQMPDLA